MHDYFLWNLPLFIDARILKAKIESKFPGSIVDIFRPSKAEHASHGGCARILVSKDLSLGLKTSIDLGYRYPIFGKLSQPKKKSNMLQKSCYSPAAWRCNHVSAYASNGVSSDISSDFKSCSTSESRLTISTCATLNIVDFAVGTCAAIDILPGDSMTSEFDFPIFETSALEMIDICPDVTVDLVSRSKLKNFRYVLALLLRAFRNVDAGVYGLELRF